MFGVEMINRGGRLLSRDQSETFLGTSTGPDADGPKSFIG